MPRSLLLVVSVAFAWAIVPDAFAPTSLEAQAPRMRFEAMDTNRDGAISQAEWRGSPRAFQNQDWNGDGQLSGEEVRAGARRTQNWEAADHAPNRLERYNSWTQGGFTNLDHNRDRQITPNEWHFDIETFRRVDRNRDGALDQAEFLGENEDDARDAGFDDLDWNNNGRVERNEWHGGDAAFSNFDRNRDGTLTRFEVVGGTEYRDDLWDQFASLDHNRNGSVTRDEWHWSTASFDQRDANRDGVLSQRELEPAGGAPGAVATGGQYGPDSRTVNVNSQQRWTDSGIEVRAGQTVTVESSGTIIMSDNRQDTATPAGATSGRRAADAPILNQPAGALIARIGNYGPIFVGNRGRFTPPVSGRLYFGVNDDHLADNTGEFVVNLTAR